MKAVIVYADESGTHDRTGQQDGSGFPTIAGFAAPLSVWSSFCTDWKAVLDHHGAPYFHFREWVEAAKALKQDRTAPKKNPYSGWDLKTLDKFLYTLAGIAGRGNKIPIAGVIRIDAFNRLKAKLDESNPEQIELGTDPFKYSMGEFFRVYYHETRIRWGDFKSTVTFFFDRNNDRKWTSAMRQVYSEFAKKDARMSGISFVDKTKMPHLRFKPQICSRIDSGKPRKT